MFKVLVVQYKIVSVEYFMDKMEDWEIYEFYSTLSHADANNWEMTRWLMYVICQTQTKKKLELKDMLVFPWENKEGKNDIEITENQIERLKEMSQQISKYMK